MNRIIGLNSLRLFAFISVFIFHTTPYFKYGYLGVDFFFVLSSFLITYLFYKEISLKKEFSKYKFLLRRIIRIFPLYYLILIISFYIIPIIDPTVNLPIKRKFYWFFLSNYETSDCIYALKFLWSIAVEEQFYLLFLCTSFLLKKRILLLITLLTLCYFTFMILALKYNLPTYSNTIKHFPNFTAGIIGGYIFFYKKKYIPFTIFLFPVLIILNLVIQDKIIFQINTSIIFLYSILIVSQYGNKLKRFYLFNLTEKLGSYSYGLYVFSGFIITITNSLFPFVKTIYMLIIQMSLLLLLSILSYHLYEKQFLKLKKFFY